MAAITPTFTIGEAICNDAFERRLCCLRSRLPHMDEKHERPNMYRRRSHSEHSMFANGNIVNPDGGLLHNGFDDEVEDEACAPPPPRPPPRTRRRARRRADSTSHCHWICAFSYALVVETPGGCEPERGVVPRVHVACDHSKIDTKPHLTSRSRDETRYLY